MNKRTKVLAGSRRLLKRLHGRGPAKGVLVAFGLILSIAIISNGSRAVASPSICSVQLTFSSRPDSVKRPAGTYVVDSSCNLRKLEVPEQPNGPGQAFKKIPGDPSGSSVVYWWIRNPFPCPTCGQYVTEVNPQLSTTWSWDGSQIISDAYVAALAERAHNGWTVTAQSSEWTSFSATEGSNHAHIAYSHPSNPTATADFETYSTIRGDGTASCDGSVVASIPQTWTVSVWCSGPVQGTYAGMF